MKKKQFLFFLLSTMLTIILSSKSCTKNPEHRMLLPKETTRSVIGITGKDSSAPYIEIFYTRKKDDISNEVVHEWVKPPYLFGDIPVIGQIRKICGPVGTSKKCTEHIYCIYTPGGDSYLKIINHSNNPIEMFVATNFPTIITKVLDEPKLPTACNSTYTLGTIFPTPIYQNAPIYYLLFPDKTPNIIDIMVFDVFSSQCIANHISYTPTQIGNLSITRAWTIEEIMKLYRAEYNKSADTILYAYYITPGNGNIPPQRISLLENKIDDYYGWYSPRFDIYKSNRMYGFYKKINGLDSFVSANEKWYPMTNAIITVGGE